MFIVIEGIDGSGKGTQVQEVAKKLEADGKKVLILDFPRYNEPSSYFVQEYLNSEYGTNIDPKVASYFYALDRYDAYQKNSNYWNNHDYIISNRYTSASMIHQGGKYSAEKDKLDFFNRLSDLEYNQLGLPKPDKVIILDVSPEIANKYVESKAKRKYIKYNKNKDLHESDKDHLTNAYKTIDLFAKTHDNVLRINCTDGNEMKPIEAITNQIIKNINN